MVFLRVFLFFSPIDCIAGLFLRLELGFCEPQWEVQLHSRDQPPFVLREFAKLVFSSSFSFCFVLRIDS